MCNCQEALRARASEVNALGLVVHATEAAKSHVAYSRALGSSRRAEVLIGEGAGRERAWMAEQYFASRTSSLRHLAQALEDFRESADPSRVSRADELIEQGAVAEVLVLARSSAVAALVDSDVSPDTAISAMTALDQRMEEIRSAASFGQLTELAARYTQEHVARTYEEAAQDNSLCMVILILSSLYVALIAYAIVFYIILLGLVPLNEILDGLISSVCSSIPLLDAPRRIFTFCYADYGIVDGIAVGRSCSGFPVLVLTTLALSAREGPYICCICQRGARPPGSP
jgi:hypothetical protein